MKKVLFAIPLALALTGCGSDIDLVKGGVMEFNQTTTLGKALDNWKSCESREWEKNRDRPRLISPNMVLQPKPVSLSLNRLG